jgi:magnesium chelatase subunit I
VTITAPADMPRTAGELRASGSRLRGVKDEIRENLLLALRAGRSPWDGIVGFDGTVLPQLERALLAGHDVVLLGERGQGKTRLLRSLPALLDEWTPVIEGSDLGEHPFAPITPASVRRANDLGDDLPVAWRHRSQRYTEKLATPDTAVADLIGDVDPVKVAEGRSLGDPETIHYGLVPRAHRGIVAINELPDLAERIQVSLLNVMEERDIQVRGYTLRLPLDVLLVASANPEDYTNRGRIITPLKDRFGAEIRTHYPLELADRRPTWSPPSPTICWRSWPGSPGCCASPQRSTRVPGSPPGSRWPAPRPSPAPRCAGPRWSGRAPQRRGPSTCSRCRPCCGASWSSPPVRRVGRTRCSSTCCAGPPPTPHANGCAAWTWPPWPRRSAPTRCAPAIWYPAPRWSPHCRPDAR